MKNNMKGVSMREILFRGKAIKDGEYKKGSWIYGSLYRSAVDDKEYIFNCGTDDKVLVDPETVGQCIGIKDYGGKYKTYEGDIVQDLDDGTLGIVYWDEEEAGFKISFEHWIVPIEDISYYQVIGNKWDNPELVKE